jgi:hypothetical protein
MAEVSRGAVEKIIRQLKVQEKHADELRKSITLLVRSQESKDPQEAKKALAAVQKIAKVSGIKPALLQKAIEKECAGVVKIDAFTIKQTTR